MARVTGERWVIDGNTMRVYDEAECPICQDIKEVRMLAEFHQASLIPGMVADVTWSLLHCVRCDRKYMYRTQWNTADDPSDIQF